MPFGKIKSVTRKSTPKCIEKQSVVGHSPLSHQYDKISGNQGGKGSPQAETFRPRTGKGCQPTSVKGCI